MNPILRRILQLLFIVAIQAAILFLAAGRPGWLAGWLYIGLYLMGLTVAAVVMLPRHGEVMEERSKGAAGGKSWDIWLTRFLSIPAIGLLLVAGLDERLGWEPHLIGVGWQTAGAVLFMGGYGVIVWAMMTNRFFSSVVRIQTERGHKAVSGGPYRFVRHPGYVGMMISSLGGVLLLGSSWALIPYALYMATMLVRTALEDRTLRAELPGYAEYAGQTRFRLFPGVW